jgi:hypothetical protein
MYVHRCEIGFPEGCIIDYVHTTVSNPGNELWGKASDDVRGGVQYTCIIDNVSQAGGVRLRKLMQVSYMRGRFVSLNLIWTTA